MRFLFIVQGEGRGHMTQAIALSQILKNIGHKHVATCIGKSKRRKIPDFVFQNLKGPIYQIESPNFISDKNNKKILLGKSIFFNLFKLPKFLNSLKEIDEAVTFHKPDVIINFYDILGGIYKMAYRPKAISWVIGHQYLIFHPAFPYAKSSFLEKTLFKLNTKITAIGADRVFALSFQKYPEIPNSKVTVFPPILRELIFNLRPQHGDFILTYMVNSGYGDEVIRFAKKNPEIKIEAFWDKKDFEKTYQALPNLVFHQVDDKLFLEKMASCRGLLSTAGFESICEAMYLGKPVMMVPVAGQYEQACNAIDAVNAAAGICNHEFDFEFFHDYLNSNQYNTTQMKSWVGMASRIFKQEIEKAEYKLEEIESQKDSSSPDFLPI
ncbi:glycosyltransferase [Belliella sp. R4-6]|uniref:Glycosyltransferase n=1 Tax=Belliella alkalica TaxID=1730871 RepID=A0ABS9VE15_9BACT|nr:glycosyltransferase family protein [Belliella alkalica]MCH7414429.1 glycosyltransferase [Belliella alkalica]